MKQPVYIIWKLIVIEALIIGFQSLLYFGSELLQHNFHDVSRPVDRRIPLVPAWVFPYFLWYPVLAIFPFTLYFFSREDYIISQVAWLVAVVVSTVIYLVYPTTFDRPKPPNTFSGRFLVWIYKASFRGINCAPSLHCSTSFIILAVSLGAAELPLVARVVFAVIAVGIVIGTLFTKQHVVIDVVSAIPIAVLGLGVGWSVVSQGLTEAILGPLGL
ncbi:MAG: serine/threonine protein phosphatase [Mobiluncus porci]|uniref:phosphatase PAP2 family protein n=1 Tax=Mobiluncus TaxID=2050 RepID=UPI0023F43DFB|nr:MULTISPECIES: phosphatase PAP2 family protein [Mobiluncus]MCI6585291.1 serine/threonine protein phosphatase [Mobiluncus sp.]MDD7541498.1 serine/threonine protein phosphatase [Mobiluncus porci]MDY5748483.1 serine/threonine protein phosphatase [Mobiluncus porci]